MKKIVWGIVGPTASGKTALSIPLAQYLKAEILCMDSMQVYKGMDIGTAKPTLTEQSALPHHLLDLVSPETAFTVSDYAAMAKPLLDRIPVPMLVGGTGLYLQALSSDQAFGQVKGDEMLREKLHALAAERGPAFLHRQLAHVDPDYAQKIHANDLRRVVRALEVYELTGIPFSKQPQSAEESPYEFRLFALDLPRDVLYQRINARVDAMMTDGLLEEVKRLKDGGLPGDASCMQGLGYKELYTYLDGACTLADAVSLIKLRTRHFAKRQLTWFRRDERIHWLDGTLSSDQLLQSALKRYDNKEVQP